MPITQFFHLHLGIFLIIALASMVLVAMIFIVEVADPSQSRSSSSKNKWKFFIGLLVCMIIGILLAAWTNLPMIPSSTTGKNQYISYSDALNANAYGPTQSARILLRYQGKGTDSQGVFARFKGPYQLKVHTANMEIMNNRLLKNKKYWLTFTYRCRPSKWVETKTTPKYLERRLVDITPQDQAIGSYQKLDSRLVKFLLTGN